MKAIFYSFAMLLVLGVCHSASAQSFPNNGFETWATPNTVVEAPTGWQTTDLILAYLNQIPANNYYNTQTVTKITDVHSGSFAAKLSTLSLPTTSGGSVTVPGLLVLGSKPGIYTYRGFPNAGAAFATRPTQLQFYYKFSGLAADSASVLVYFTKTSGAAGSAPTVLGGALQYLAPTTGGYAAVSIPIQYSSSTLPDSVHLQFSSGSARVIRAGTTLQLDDITFSNTALAVRADASLQELLSVAPNPSPAGRFVVSSPAQPELAAAPLTVFDVTGREVLRQAAQATPTAERVLDLSTLPLGIYTLRLDSKQGALVRQLVVK
ncbi:T9SS type A sorting domain-containing protein [Hymenobacter sp. HMF4947]|uniref:T9SS type A sorting domain-containing protein n=1 Tax=Hymenobacter ginkgonis TaxID=2682976 RepID=A0A7K1TIS1_9BACT|nr:T9SS type A sorting domain-containing protein [Hymenobacter ginkgonis]MVN78310.1 T9SS type A sorting domain-containing protein [Hymenobacter ginkgonis]